MSEPFLLKGASVEDFVVFPGQNLAPVFQTQGSLEAWLRQEFQRIPPAVGPFKVCVDNDDGQLLLLTGKEQRRQLLDGADLEDLGTIRLVKKSHADLLSRLAENGRMDYSEEYAESR